MTASFGVASADSPDIVSLDELIRCADNAVYEAKETGRNRVCVSNSLTSINSDYSSEASGDRIEYFRELLLKGTQSLSEAELIAILIASGSKNESAVELSKSILKSVKLNLAELSKLSVKDLMKFNGIGEAKAISIIAALELGKRRRSSEIIEKKSITSSRDAFEFFQGILNDVNYEEFHILLLNRDHRRRSC